MQITMNDPVYSTHCRVLYGDTDAAGVVYNANYLRYFEIGRTEMMRAWVCSYRDIEKLGIVLPVTECFSRFKAPAYYDDLLTIETSIAMLRRVSCRFNYRIIRQEEGSERPKLLVKGYTIHASINREGKLAPLPAQIMARIVALSPDRENNNDSCGN